ncbi:hypothetical protein [Bacillus phage BC-T25]|nr:hypothetical protein [Bacillus phage BC-T25]
MDTTVYKLGDEFLETTADEETVQAIIYDLKQRNNDVWDMDDIIQELDKQGETGRSIEINTNLKGW